MYLLNGITRIPRKENERMSKVDIVIYRLSIKLISYLPYTNHRHLSRVKLIKNFEQIWGRYVDVSWCTIIIQETCLLHMTFIMYVDYKRQEFYVVLTASGAGKTRRFIFQGLTDVNYGKFWETTFNNIEMFARRHFRTSH